VGYPMCGKSVVNVFGGSFVNFQVNFFLIILDIGYWILDFLKLPIFRGHGQDGVEFFNGIF